MDQEAAIDVFSSLAQPTRLAVFKLLVGTGTDGLPALEIARKLGVVPSTLSGHLSILKHANVVTATRHQREIHYAANLEMINALIGFLLSDCCGGKVENCAEVLTLLDAN